MIKIGFTGTQIGMQKLQKRAFRQLIWELIGEGNQVEFHHGDCKGADKEAHNFIVNDFETELILHPPKIDSKRAFCDFSQCREPKLYLDRNKDIVAESEIMIATPKEFAMQWKGSGTWATIRYAKQAKKPLYIIFPDGSITKENLI